MAEMTGYQVILFVNRLSHDPSLAGLKNTL